MSDSTTTRTAPPPVGHYPHARRVGNLLFLSGLGPRSPGGGPIPGVTLDAAGAVADHDIEVQCRAVFANVRAVLEAAGSSWERLVDVTVFLTDMPRDFATFNRLWAEHFPTESALPHDGRGDPAADADRHRAEVHCDRGGLTCVH
jgi:2-aminomuconate deaminase